MNNSHYLCFLTILQQYMFNHWLEASSVSTKGHPVHSWAKNIKVFHSKPVKLAPKQCVLIGIDKVAADAVRKVLYPMSWSFPGLKMTDLGNLRKKEIDFVIPLLKEIMEGQIFPIIIGTKPNMVFAQFQAFLNIRDHVSLVAIDERVPLSLSNKKNNQFDYLNKILHQRKESLFHLGVIGSQAYFTNPEVIDCQNKHNYEYLPLGHTQKYP